MFIGLAAFSCAGLIVGAPMAAAARTARPRLDDAAAVGSRAFAGAAPAASSALADVRGAAAAGAAALTPLATRPDTAERCIIILTVVLAATGDEAGEAPGRGR
eukprot:356123-Chlamydomonas_euryale.AAC.9